MNRIKSVFSVYLAIGLMIFGFLAQAEAQTNRNDREVRDIIRSLNSEIDDFRYNLDNELSRISISRDEREEINGYVRDLENSVSQFDAKFQRGRDSADDVKDILADARRVDDFVLRNRFGSRSQSDWMSVRNLLDRLAVKYNVRGGWNGNTSNYPNNNPSNYPNTYPTNNTNSFGLTGTYDLDSSRSENASEIADRALRNSNAQNNDNARQDLESRLEAPSQLAIDVRGNQVILASSKGAPVSFAADGREKTETLAGGETIRVRATFRGQELVISSIGGESDYTVTFASTDGGRSLKVTRRFTTDYLNQTVFAESVYNKTDSLARLGIDTGNYSNTNGDVYSSSDSSDNPNNYPTNNPNNYPRTTYPSNGNFIVPNGTILTGNLDNLVTTKATQNNDRFRMTVTSPNEYRGAVIEGYVSSVKRTGKVTGRSEVTFNFERIRLPNGQTYDFAGFLQSITDTSGKSIRVDAEGAAKGDSQTKESVKRGGIGAGIGAIIGAIAGGAKGAAIGAIIGGGAGAGSVVLEGRDDLELQPGSTITVQSSSPSR